MSVLSVYWSKLGVRKRVGHFKRKFQGNEGLPTNDCWRQKNRVPGLSCGVVCVILRLAVDTIPACDRHTMTANTCTSIASRG